MKTFIAILALAVASVTGFAQTDTNTASSGLLTPSKFKADIFGTYRAEGENQYGGGLGLRYYLNENIGVSGWTVVEDTGGVTFDNGYGAFIVRLPLGDTISPYALAGGGYNWTYAKVSGLAGGGLELKLTKNVTAFGDYIWEFVEDSSENFGRARVGVSFGL